MVQPADYIDTAKANQQALEAEKGEFETTQEYKKRMVAAEKALAIKTELFHHPNDYGRPDSGVTYNANEQQFRFFVGSSTGTLNEFDYTSVDKVIFQDTKVSEDMYHAIKLQLRISAGFAGPVGTAEDDARWFWQLLPRDRINTDFLMSA